MYLDMDGVLVDIFKACSDKYGKDSITKIGDLLDEDPQLFYEAEPIPGAIEAFNKLEASVLAEAEREGLLA